MFLIGEELEFRTGQTEGEPTFVWRDMDGGVDEFYEFVAIGTNGPTQALFETCMYRAMYERKYKKPADHLADADLQEFIFKSVVPHATYSYGIRLISNKKTSGTKEGENQRTIFPKETVRFQRHRLVDFQDEISFRLF